jgi:hypothetical protein
MVVAGRSKIRSRDSDCPSTWLLLQKPFRLRPRSGREGIADAPEVDMRYGDRPNMVELRNGFDLRLVCPGPNVGESERG